MRYLSPVHFWRSKVTSESIYVIVGLTLAGTYLVMLTALFIDKRFHVIVAFLSAAAAGALYLAVISGIFEREQGNVGYYAMFLIPLAMLAAYHALKGINAAFKPLLTEKSSPEL